MKPQAAKVVRSPCGRSISIEQGGTWIIARDFGAQHIWLVPSEPVAGVRRFLTTDGKALFHEADGCFYLHDSRLVVRIDSTSWEPQSWERHGPYIITELVAEGSEIALLRRAIVSRDALDMPEESQRKRLPPPSWNDGLGSAAQDFFPSSGDSSVESRHLLDDMMVS